jgi:hypothetical protein
MLARTAMVPIEGTVLEAEYAAASRRRQSLEPVSESSGRLEMS